MTVNLLGQSFLRLVERPILLVFSRGFWCSRKTPGKSNKGFLDKKHHFGFSVWGGGVLQFFVGRFRLRWSGPKGHLTSHNPSLFCYFLCFFFGWFWCWKVEASPLLTLPFCCFGVCSVIVYIYAVASKLGPRFLGFFLRQNLVQGCVKTWSKIFFACFSPVL